MAGDWIKLRVDLHDDPAVIGIAAETGLDEFAVVGRLTRLWSWADRQSRDGHASSVTVAWLNRYVQRDGFAEAMQKAGWLIVANGGVSFPNFDRHNGKPAKDRALAKDRKVTQRSRDERDVTVTREEKRRDITPIVPARFDEFWKEYPGPRKVNKPKCMQAWLAGGFTAVADQILLHVAAMKLTAQWQEANGKFIPAPLTYLNQRRFEDGMPEAPVVRLAV